MSHFFIYILIAWCVHFGDHHSRQSQDGVRMIRKPRDLNQILLGAKALSKRSVFIPVPKKVMPKNVQTTAFISHASKAMLKIHQVRLQQYMNRELPDVQAEFRKSRGTRDQIANNRWNTGKAREFQKNMYFCFIGYTKAFDCVDHNNPWKFLKRWEYQTTLPASWEICMQVKKQELKRDIEQQTGSKLGKEYVKTVYCHPVYLTYIQSTSYKMRGWMKHKLESRLPGSISITSDMQMTPPLWQKAKKN